VRDSAAGFAHEFEEGGLIGAEKHSAETKTVRNLEEQPPLAAIVHARDVEEPRSRMDGIEEIVIGD
jgi:hypothetical protein